MADITFRGISASGMGMIVEKMPDAARAKRNARMVEIPGRDGYLTLDDKTYKSIRLTAQINVLQGATQEQIDDWLNGYGDLILSDDPGKKYIAMATEEVKALRYRPFGANYDTITAVFDCQPHRYESTPSMITLTTSGVITNPGSVSSEPILTVYGSGDISLLVAGKTVAIAGLSGSIVIDCEAKLAYRDNGDGTQTLLTNSVTLPGDEWPTMPPGPVPVSWTGSVSKVEVRGNWRWL